MSIISECIKRITNQRDNNNEIKGYKVANATRTRKIGVACRSFQELKRKSKEKFQMTENLSSIEVFLPDGSEVDEDYFKTLPPQTTFIVQKSGEVILTEADILYDTLKRVNIDLLSAGDEASKFITENVKRKVAILNRMLNKNDNFTLLSKRDDHPEWFSELETSINTKEAFLHRRCQDRIRGYLHKAIEQIKSSESFNKNANTRQRLLQIIAFFKAQLKEDHYFGYYFDRSRAKKVGGSDQTDCAHQNFCYKHCECRLMKIDVDENQDARENNIEKKDDEVDARCYKSPSESKTKLDNEYLNKIISSGTRDEFSLCNYKGEFECKGVWSKKKCLYSGKHKINPYRSKEELILFSTWNFDHKIERSRSLVPKLLEMASSKTYNIDDIISIYEDFFTIKNMRLVHIICHDKGSHK